MKLKALKAAFPHTIPILTGYGFLGLSFGIYMYTSGFPFWYPLLMSITIYGGSIEFIAVEMLLSPFAPIQVFIMTLLTQARHIFYGLSILGKYKGLGWKKFYLIYGMTDETFSINYSVDVPQGVDKGWFLFFITLLDHSYWIMGSLIGGIVGSMLSFDTRGINFVMTSMFVVIFMNQWLNERNHSTSIMGLIVSVVCLEIFGSNSFMIPTMITILVMLWILRKPIENIDAKTEAKLSSYDGGETNDAQ